MHQPIYIQYDESIESTVEYTSRNQYHDLHLFQLFASFCIQFGPFYFAIVKHKHTPQKGSERWSTEERVYNRFIWKIAKYFYRFE